MALSDVLQAAVVKPVLVGWLDFKDSPVRGWSGPGAFVPTGTGDPDLDGQAFIEAESAVDVTDIHEDTGLGGPVTITFSAGELDNGEAVAQELVSDRRPFLRRKARLWRFFLNESESAVLPEYTPMFSGVMVGAETQREPGKPALISVTCDQDLSKAQAAPVRWIDHQVFESGDTASTFINALNRGGIASAQQTPIKPFNGMPVREMGWGPGNLPPVLEMEQGESRSIEEQYHAMLGYNPFL